MNTSSGACRASSAIRCRFVETVVQPRCVGHRSLQRVHLSASPSLHGVSWTRFPRFAGTMRRSDSSPPIPPRFVAFARRYHPSTCGFAPSDARCAVHDLGLGEPVTRRPAVSKMETTRPPGFPGNPPARMPRCFDPGEVAASTASGKQQCCLPPNARRQPSHLCISGLGRMGLNTHRVSNKVSKITSRHLVPLDRAFPAHALLHDSSLTRSLPSWHYFSDRCGRMLAARVRSSGSMRAYSMDLRERVLRESDAGMKAAAVAVTYHVSASWVRRLKQRRRETGEVAPRQHFVPARCGRSRRRGGASRSCTGPTRSASTFTRPASRPTCRAYF